MNNSRWLSKSSGLGQYTGNFADALPGTAMFLDANGNNRQDFICGEFYQFVVKDYSEVWLTQYKDGALQYDGPIAVPSGYTSICETDPGTYNGTVFTIAPGGGKGVYLSDSAATLYRPEDNPDLNDWVEENTGGLLSTNTLLLAAGSLLMLMMFGKRGKKL